jgi:hypothetical protein
MSGEGFLDGTQGMNKSDAFEVNVVSCLRGVFNLDKRKPCGFDGDSRVKQICKIVSPAKVAR